MKYIIEPGDYSQEDPKDTKDTFYGKDGNAWKVYKEGDKYWFSFISGELQGDVKSYEISQNDYELARNQKIKFDDLYNKYVKLTY